MSKFFGRIETLLVSFIKSIAKNKIHISCEANIWRIRIK